MPLRLSTTLTFCLSLALSACSSSGNGSSSSSSSAAGPARPRLSAITEMGGPSATFNYSGDQLASATTINSDGTLNCTATLQYNGNLVSTITSAYPGSDTQVRMITRSGDQITALTDTDQQASTTLDTISYTYTGDQVSQEVDTDPSNSETDTYTYTYAGGKLSLRVVTDTVGSNAPTEETTQYSYDSSGHLTNIQQQSGGTTDITLFTYDSSGHLTEVAEGQDTYTLQYSGGNISQTIEQYNGTTTIVNYTYDQGEVADVVPEAIIAKNKYFDLKVCRKLNLLTGIGETSPIDGSHAGVMPWRARRLDRNKWMLLLSFFDVRAILS